jgi:hypothetical protein
MTLASILCVSRPWAPGPFPHPLFLLCLLSFRPLP